MKDKIKALVPYIIILVVVLLIRAFIVTPVRVNGSSMDDTLHGGDILILNKLDTNYKRFDIVVLDSDVVGDAAIKRIVALPGETIEIENGNIYIDTKKLNDPYNTINMDDLDKITLNDDQYFVLGDNREVSIDSRYFGPVSLSDIEGTTHLRLWPINDFGTIK